MPNPTLLATATVSAANTATRITAGESSPTTRIAAGSCVIQAKSDNAAVIYVGDSTVQSSTAKGIELAAGSTLTMSSEPSPNGLNLADIYFASTSSTAKVNVLYLVL